MKTEMKIKIFNGRISQVNAVIMEDGTCRLDLEVEMAEKVQKKIECSKDNLMLVKASELSSDDSFMKHKPKTDEEEKLKKYLKEAIKLKIGDFYKPIYDPSFTDSSKTSIQYVAGEKPAVGKSWNFWNEFIKETEWSWGSKHQYAAFLGVIIKSLVNKGWSVEKAWSSVANDSKELGHYWNSENAKHEFEDTGSREICGHYDLANTYKILDEDEEAGGFWLVGGSYYGSSHRYPLVDFELSHNYNCNRDYGVPWLVIEK